MKNLKNIIIFSVLGITLLITIIFSFNQKKNIPTYNPKNDYIERTDINSIPKVESVGFGRAKKK